VHRFDLSLLHTSKVVASTLIVVRGFCTAEEEAMKSQFEALDATRVGTALDSLDNEDDLEDLSLLNEKEREKVLARRKKEADRFLLKKQKEEAKGKRKNKRAKEKAKKA
jgi:hypothetical protein